MNASTIVQKLWNYCNVLRDDGMSYGDYVEQLTYLLFLKMADERSRPPYKQASLIPEPYAWPALLKRDGDDLFDHYRHTLEKLGAGKGTLALIFNKAQNKFQHRAKRRRLLWVVWFGAALLMPVSLPVRAHLDDLVKSFMDGQETKRAESVDADVSGRPLWEIDAKVPFVGSPVHERMMVASINLSQVHGRPFRLDYDDAYIHGVFWNDDPLDMLCPSCSALNLLKFDKRWGIEFALRFDAAKKRAHGDSQTPPYFFTKGDGLLERSHFGDLQFLHGMAVRDGEKARETQAKILDWAEFVYKVATGAIDQRGKVADIPIATVRELLDSDPAIEDRRIDEMFRGRLLARRVAIGSLLHMIQDSYAPGHAERIVRDFPDKDGKTVFSRGAVIAFHSYVNQDSDKHAADDKWPPGMETPALDSDDNPISVGARILVLLYRGNGLGAPWPEVRDYLANTVFKLENPEAKAGPGDKYDRRKQ